MIVIAYQASPVGEPAECSFDDPTARRDLEVRFGVDAADDFDDEVEESGPVKEMRLVVSAVRKQVLDPGPTLADGVGDPWREALSEISAAVKRTISGRPSVSTATCRLRTSVPLAAS